MAKVLVPLATGFEEIEAVSMIDIMRRGGIEVTAAYLDKELVKGANGITIKADVSIDDIDADSFDMIALPGGWGGTYILADDARVQSLLKSYSSGGKYVAAMCAAPYALHLAGVLSDSYTCYPSTEEKIGRTEGYTPDRKVVVDGRVITSRGPGTAICYALAIVRELMGDANYNAVRSGTLSEHC